MKILMFGTNKKASLLKRIARALSQEKENTIISVIIDDGENRDPSLYYTNCLTTLHKADLLVLELSEPSHGTGFLCREAEKLRKVIIGIYHLKVLEDGVHFTPSMSMIEYEDESSLLIKLIEYL